MGSELPHLGKFTILFNNLMPAQVGSHLEADAQLLRPLAAPLEGAGGRTARGFLGLYGHNLPLFGEGQDGKAGSHRSHLRKE
jgi:hypothetical protein